MVVEPTRQLGPYLAGALRPASGTLELHLWGEVDMSAEPALSVWLAEAMAEGRRVVIDLSGVAFIDLRGARTIIAAADEHAALVTLRGGPPVLDLVLPALGTLCNRLVVEPDGSNDHR